MSSSQYTSNNFDLTQSLWLFSWIANYSGAPCGSPKELADYVFCCLNGADPAHPNPFPDLKAPNLLKNYTLANGDWELVWGPAVYEINPCAQKADNTAYVVHDKNTDTYVVAIAGTDAGSILDWAVEDFTTGKNDRVNWEKFYQSLDPEASKATEGPEDSEQISYGTAFGVKCLLTDPEFGENHFALSTWAPTNTSLETFLKDLKGKAKNVIVTGHSLGGALSPTLARWIYDYWALDPISAEQNGTKIYAMPTAGPTPGNKLYQDSWDNVFTPDLPDGFPKFNAKNYVTELNRDIGNDLDAVPHGWQYIFQAIDIGKKEHYFWLSEHILSSKIGHFESTLDQKVDVGAFTALVKYLQVKGNNADLTRSSHYQTFFEKPEWPIQVNNGEPIKDLSNKTVYDISNGGFKTFLTNVGMIHVWGYSTAAFGIDFSVMQDIAAK